MKPLLLLPFLLLAGCTPPQTSAPVTQTPTKAPVTQTPTKAPAKLTSAQEIAKFCRVCVVDKGERMEEFLPTRLDKKHEGKLYKFCSEPCRKSFDASPKKYQLPNKSGA